MSDKTHKRLHEHTQWMTDDTDALREMHRSLVDGAFDAIERVLSIERELRRRGERVPSSAGAILLRRMAEMHLGDSDHVRLTHRAWAYERERLEEQLEAATKRLDLLGESP